MKRIKDSRGIINRFSGKYFFLSNFAFCDVVYEGTTYKTVEHAFQASKSLDTDTRKLFLQADTPADAKRLGRQVKLRSDWESVKLDIMKELLRQKFNQEPFHTLLVGTGNAELVEGNYWNDTYWGVCNGIGENHLGKLLMEIRQEINNFN